MWRVYRLTRAAGARLSAALFSFLPVMNEKHAAAGAMDSLHPKLLHSHRIHFSENNEASLVLPAAAFWKTARNLNLSSVRYFYYLWCRNGTFTGRDVLTNRTQPGFALVPAFLYFRCRNDTSYCWYVLQNRTQPGFALVPAFLYFWCRNGTLYCWYVLQNCTQFEPVLRPVFLLPLVP